jgi:cytoskeletal protein RodZ
MDKDKRGKSLAFWLVLFFLIVILLGAFVGKRLVQIVRASIDPEATTEVQENIGKQGNEKGPYSSDIAEQLAPLEVEGGYPIPSPTPTQPPSPTTTLPPTATHTSTATETTIPTNTPTRTVFIVVEETETPTSMATLSPTPTQTRTPSTPPTVGPEGNPGNYIGAGMVLGLIGLACFYLYFWNLTQNRRER